MDHPTIQQQKEDLLERARKLFQERFSESPSIWAIAPGRINLIGEHTDYQGGFVFPAAINRYVVLAASRATGLSKVISSEFDTVIEFDSHFVQRPKDKDWGSYIQGIPWVLKDSYQIECDNLNIVCVSDLPVGAGLSSSAAIEMSSALLWLLNQNRELPAHEVAKIGQRVENEFVGMRCGIMDQTACIFGQADHALFVDTLKPESPVPVSFPHDLIPVICDTQVKHSLASSEYNTRRDETEIACHILGVEYLRDLRQDCLQQFAAKLPQDVFRRVRHVVTENSRVVEFQNALRKGQYERLGPLLRESHESLARDFKVSCFELDAMARIANESEGCLGARMMGGGFGGSCIALVRTGFVEDFKSHVEQNYFSETGIQGKVFECRIVDGARAEAI